MTAPRHDRCGSRLRLLREQRGLTQRKVADELQSLAWFRTGSHLATTADLVSKWERGSKQPGPFAQELLCLLFQATPAALGFTRPALPDPLDCLDGDGPVPPSEILAALGENGTVLGPKLVDRWEAEQVKRRSLLKSLGLLPVAAAAPKLLSEFGHAPAARADEPTLRSLQALTGQYQRMYHATAPSVLLTPVTAHLDLVDELLDDARGGRTRLRLLGNHSQVAMLAGRLSFFDLRDAMAARGYYSAALDSAREARDHALLAGLYGHMAFLAVAAGHHSAAAEHLQQAAAAAARTGVPALASWVQAVTSEVRADAGDESGALNAVAAAEQALRQIPSHPRPPWFDFYDETRLCGFAGYAYMRLGRHDEAGPALRDALEDLPRGASKQRSVFLTDLATVTARRGDLDEGCQLACDAARSLGEAGYATGAGRLRHFRAAFAPRAGARAMRELDELLAAV